MALTVIPKFGASTDDVLNGANRLAQNRASRTTLGALEKRTVSMPAMPTEASSKVRSASARKTAAQAAKLSSLLHHRADYARRVAAAVNNQDAEGVVNELLTRVAACNEAIRQLAGQLSATPDGTRKQA